MKLSTVTDLSDHSYTATTYAYDGFGRRTLTQTEGHTATRTLYYGTGFEVLRQGTADSNGSFINPTEAQNRYSPYYPYNGGGYYGNRYGYADYFYYLFFGGLWGFGAGGHGSIGGKEEAPEYLTIENMYPIYANGTVAGTHKEDLVYSPHKHYWNNWTNFWGADTSRYDDYATYKETLYFGTDALGSVRTTSSYSVFDFGSINYDVFGTPYRRAGSYLNSESLDFGYLGKPYNADTQLYDYGFRDYSPKVARFSTVDPIRDGRNWYAYVTNDPVNYVDLWGLDQFRIPSLYTMQKGDWATTKLKGDTKWTIGDSGCAIICVSNWLALNPKEINNKYVSKGNIQWRDIADDYGYNVVKENKPITKEVYTKQAEDESKLYTTFINVNWNDKNYEHWVGMNSIETVNGKDYCVITVSSVNDSVIANTTIVEQKDGSYIYNGQNNNRLGKGWLNENGQILIPTEQVKGYVTFSKECYRSTE